MNTTLFTQTFRTGAAYYTINDEEVRQYDFIHVKMIEDKNNPEVTTHLTFSRNILREMTNAGTYTGNHVGGHGINVTRVRTWGGPLGIRYSDTISDRYYSFKTDEAFKNAIARWDKRINRAHEFEIK